MIIETMFDKGDIVTVICEKTKNIITDEVIGIKWKELSNFQYDYKPTPCYVIKGATGDYLDFKIFENKEHLVKSITELTKKLADGNNLGCLQNVFSVSRDFKNRR